VECLVCHSRTV